MTTIEQWQAGGGIPGSPPWDGTGIPFPVGEDGWPVIPGGGGGGGVTLGTLTGPTEVPNYQSYHLDLVTNADETSIFLQQNYNGGAWGPFNPMVLVDATHFSFDSQAVNLGVGDIVGMRAHREPDDGVASNEVFITVTAPLEDPEAEAEDAKPRSDWSVKRLDDWARNHADLAPEYPFDANKPEKLAYLNGAVEGD
jgi:hypothetical protein